MSAGANSLADRPHDSLAVVLEELPNALRVHRRHVDVRRVMDMDVAAVLPAATRSIRHETLRPRRLRRGDDHLALVDLGDHVVRELPGSDRKRAGDGHDGGLPRSGGTSRSRSHDWRKEAEDARESLSS